MIDPKAIRKALMIARAIGRDIGLGKPDILDKPGKYARGGYADGGLPDDGDLPLVGPTINRVKYDPSVNSQLPVDVLYKSGDDQKRAWVKSAALPAINPDNLVNYEPVSPVFHSRVDELLADPNALNQMKMGRPQQWAKYLKKQGAKPEEISMYGIGEGDPNVKVSREHVRGLLKGKIPTIREKLLGGSGGDEDIELNHGEWEVEEPDWNWLRDEAIERRKEDYRDAENNPRELGDHVGDALESFSEKWLKGPGGQKGYMDPNTFNPERMKGFLSEVLNNGMAHENKVVPVASSLMKGNIRLHDWHDLIKNINENVENNFHEPDVEKGQNLPGLEPKENEIGSLVERKLFPYERAVEGLHGSKDPNIMQHLEDAYLNDEDVLDEMVRDAERYYYDDDESPKSKSVSVTNPRGRDYDYIINDSGYGGGFHVISPNGNRLGTTHSEDEAEALIRQHAMEKLGIGPNLEGQKNITVPKTKEGGKYGAGSGHELPGVEDYREHTIQYKNPNQEDFNESHYDPNTLVHMRYGTVKDDNDRRLLYLDEIQSDWHQKGRDRGYNTPEAISGIASARERHREAEKDLEGHREHIATGLGFSGRGPATDKYAGFMLLDPNEKLNDDYQQQIFRTHGSLLMNNPDLANAMFGSGSETLTAPELLKNFHNYSRDAFGPNYRQVASDLNSAMERERSLRSAARGDFVPDAPWKQTSEWTKLALKRALRVAADYGYDGVALSPGWVQKERWRNEDHKNLYDNLMGNTFRNLAKQHGLKVGNSTIQQLRDYARRKRVTDKSADSATAVYLNDDDRAKIRKHGFGLFKRGGFVAKADGGEVKDLLATADRLGVDKANIPALQNLRGMMGTHKNLMQAIRDETNSRMEQARQLHESGVLPFPVGTRFSTKHSRENGLPPFNVRGHYVNPKTGRYGYFVERGHPDSDFHEQTVMYADKPEITTEFQPYGISVAKAYGGGVEETVPEAPHTLAAQLQAFLQGKRRAVLYTHEEPALPEGAGRLETPHGVFHYNPALIDADAIKDAVAKDKINEVLGLGPYSKADIMERVASGEPGVAVVGRDAEGKEFLSATGTPGTFSEQAAAIAPQLPPGGQVRAENPANVLFERVMAARSPDQGGKDARKALMIAKAKGGGIEDDDAPDRELDKSGFYNAAAEAAKAIPQAKGTPQQMLSMVQKAPGTQEAMKWSGADQAFADQPIVSKDDLVNHFKTNAPKLEETQFGGRQSNMPTKYSSKTIPGGENYREVLLHLPPEGLLKITPANLDRINFLKQNKSDLIRKTADAMADWKRISEENAPGHPQTLEAYQQVKDTRNSLRSVEEELENLTKDFGKNKYNSPHWDKSNVVAHLRMSDRTLPQTGEKALHLEELQSDWGQAGREGFKKTDEELRGLRDEMLAAHKNYLALHAAGAPSDELKAAEDKYNSAMDVFNKGFKANTPEGPYVGNTAKWTELGLKRALIEAARNGHDKLVWTPGDEQALRYKENDEENDAKRLKGMNKYYGEIVPSQLEKILRSIGHTAEFGTDYIKDKPYEADLDVYKHAGTGKYHVATGDKRDAPDAEDITAGPFDTYAEAMAHRDKLYKGLKAVPSLKITPAMRATISKGLPRKTGGYVPSAKNAAVEQAIKLTTKSGATLPAAVAIARQHQPGRRN